MMSERETFCWQRDFLETPTNCYIKVGNYPCETEGCPVDNAIDELEIGGYRVTTEVIELYCHSRCRLSSLSTDNSEYNKRKAVIKNG